MYYPFFSDGLKITHTKFLWPVAVFLLCGLVTLAWSTKPAIATTITPSWQPSMAQRPLRSATASVVPLSDIIQISTGGEHVCALLTTGALKCWGNNNFGQLGTLSRIRFGEVQFFRNPLPVGGINSAVAVTAGSLHTCALLSQGNVKCWGNNAAGALGSGSLDHSGVPTDVVGLEGTVNAIAAGALHTCALLGTGGVKCWGNNSFGQLGDGGPAEIRGAVDVSGLTSGVSAIAAGEYHTCAVLTDGSVKCWGRNSSGELGDGTQNQQNTPVAVSGVISGVSAIEAGVFHTCALLSSGAVQCWGDNSAGQLGNDGEKRPYLTPVEVIGLNSGVLSLGAGKRHTCALLLVGTIKCWGENALGAVGDGTYTERRLPADVAGGESGFSGLAAGGSVTCGLQGGGVKCWGDNRLGQLGDGGPTLHNTPAAAIGVQGVISRVVAGGNHTCALLGDATVQCWGANRSGQVGNGRQDEASVPVSVTQVLSPVVSVVTGGDHTCILLSSGAVKCWGANQAGQLGNGNNIDQSVPVDVVALNAGVKGLAAGLAHTCALLSSGGVTCWGDNRTGQLGDGSQTSRNTPVNVIGLSSGIVAISAGVEHTCAINTIGGLKCWGNGTLGQLGDNGQTIQLAPVNVSGLTGGVAQVSAGWYHTCAVILGGVARCWGDNRSGQLGDETHVTRRKPVLVEQVAGSVKAITSGSFFSCLLLTTGAVQCWGENELGQLGDGSLEERKLPVFVAGLGENVAALTAGSYHICALLVDSTLQCWGDHRAGQLADGAGWRAEAGIVIDSDKTYLPMIRRSKPPVVAVE